MWNYSNSLPGLPVVPDRDPAPDLDWDFYPGPAPWVPYNPNRHGANHRAWVDYSGGRVCDYGVHRFDNQATARRPEHDHALGPAQSWRNIEEQVLKP